MSNRAASFVEEWVRENAVKPVDGAPPGDTSEARLRADACLAAAKDEGIAREDIEEETGDLVAYMGAVIATLVNHPEREDAHWQMATELVATEEGRFDPPAPAQAHAESGGKSRKSSK